MSNDQECLHLAVTKTPDYRTTCDQCGEMVGTGGLRQEEIGERLKSLRPEDVVSAYYGKTGCACGCGGNYFHHSDQYERACAENGYLVGPETVNDNRVAKILATVQNNWKQVEFTGTCFSLEDENQGKAWRVYTAEKTDEQVVDWHLRYYAGRLMKKFNANFHPTKLRVDCWSSAAGPVVQIKEESK